MTKPEGVYLLNQHAHIPELFDSLLKLNIYDLAYPLNISTPITPHMVPFRMGLMRRHGDVIRDDGVSGATELISMGGHTGTHIDALSHISFHGRLHGDIDASEASRDGLFQQLGVETIPPILCRGILLDIPAAFGVKAWEAGRPITATDLDATCKHQGVEIRSGDAVLVRSGWAAQHHADPHAYIGWDTGVPGPNEAAAHWLSAQGVRLTGSDTAAYEWLAPGAGHSKLPVHRHLLMESGIYLVEHLDLEQIARDGVYEFIFVLSPLKITGATASPVRPLALSDRQSAGTSATEEEVF